MTQPLWQTYVAYFRGDSSQKEVAAQTGVDQASISRWLRGEGADTPNAGNVAAFCRGYGRSPLEGFVAAGLLEPAEARKSLPKESFALLDSLRAGDEPVDEAYEAARRELAGTEPTPAKRRRRRAV